MGDLSEPAGVALERMPVPSSYSSEVFAGTQQVTDEIIRQVRPTAVSEESRKAVTCYVQTLLNNQLGCQVIPFGSVPLKTYLPDGDIDLTVFCGFDMEETFAKNVHSVLEREEHNPFTEFVVKDVQYIRAEVKLVKCLIQNIVVDISFNQIGGLCALCFLEEVDRFIGKDHLFKRSIILIKAWCFYESRILGAYHGLISTYALEMLVLYIFHLFHLSLRGPLSVLHKFLDYFSKFDWENYCVSLNGPVLVSSLPEIVAERPDNGGVDLLLSHDFMRECVKKFSVPSKGTETNARIFMRKNLNIVDPLKENNNLGRSVSKGNFFRIRSALAYGARKLGQILLQPQEDIAADVRTYFVNTLARHGQGQRPDVQDTQQMSCCNGFLPDFLLPGVEPSHENRTHKVESFNSNVRSSECRLDSKDTGHVVDDVQEPGTFSDEASVERQRGIKESIPCSISNDGISSASHLSGDSDKLANGIQDLRITRDADKSSPLPLGYRPYGPYYYLPHRLEHGKTQNGYLYASHETPSFLPDLSGDVDCHLDSLQYGRWWYDSGDTLTNSNQPVHLAPPPLFRRKTQWDAIRQIFRQEVVPHVNVNAVAPRPAFFPSHHPLMAGGPFSIDEIPKTRGTGTFFPITDKFHPAKGRTQRQLKSPRTNCRVSTLVDRNLHAQSPGSQGMWKPRSSDIFVSSPRGKVFKKTNNFVVSSDKAGEFSSLVPPPLKTLLPQTESNRAPDSRSSSGSQSGEPVFVGNLNRFGVQLYHLKDNDDFPPLSS